jgi:hypothetical protein
VKTTAEPEDRPVTGATAADLPETAVDPAAAVKAVLKMASSVR